MLESRAITVLVSDQLQYGEWEMYLRSVFNSIEFGRMAEQNIFYEVAKDLEENTTDTSDQWAKKRRRQDGLAQPLVSIILSEHSLD